MTAENSPQNEENKGLGLRQVMSSIFAAGLGVQSSENRERDFNQGKAGTFIAAGLIFTVLFVGALAVIVKVILSGQGG